MLALTLQTCNKRLAARGVSVDHAMAHRWAIKLLPVRAKRFGRRKRTAGKRWRIGQPRR